jgi:hypothetical protein
MGRRKLWEIARSAGASYSPSVLSKLAGCKEYPGITVFNSRLEKIKIALADSGIEIGGEYQYGIDTLLWFPEFKFSYQS